MSFWMRTGVQPGQSASYGRRFTAEKPTEVATLCAGYADGYPRLLSCGKGIVEIKGMPCPVLGRVCICLLYTSRCV